MKRATMLPVGFWSALLLGFFWLNGAYAFKVTDEIPQKEYPTQELGVLAGFEWLDENRLIAVRNYAKRVGELGVYDLSKSEWAPLLTLSDIYAMGMTCLSYDRRVIHVSIRTGRDSSTIKFYQGRLNAEATALDGALVEIAREDVGCGIGRFGSGKENKVLANDWYGPVPGDRAVFPLGRKQDGYLDFGVWPMSDYHKPAEWVLQDGTRVPTPILWGELRRTRELYSRYFPYLDGYQINQNCLTEIPQPRPPMFHFVRVGAKRVDAVPMPVEAMRAIGLCRQAIALKQGYFIDASGWPAPQNGFVFGLFHIVEGRSYLIRGTANSYLVDATRVSPDGCKVAYRVAGQNYPYLRSPDTRIVNLCAEIRHELRS